MLARVGGRAQAGFLHRIGERLFIQRFSGCFHGREKRGVGETAWEDGFFFVDYFRIEHVLALRFFKIGGQGPPQLHHRIFAAPVLRSVPRSNTFQPSLLDGSAGRAIPVDDFVIRNRSEHHCQRKQMILLPGAEKAGGK